VLPSLDFPQLDFVKPSSGFHPVTWERVIALLPQNIRADNVFCTYHLPCNAHLDTLVRKARVEGRVGSPRIKLGRGTSLTHVNLHPKTNQIELV
jgi:hypothetical protein